MTDPCSRCGSEDCKCVISPARLYKNKGTVMVLAIVAGLFGFAGVGHIYLGKVKRGIVFMAGTLTCGLVGLIVVIMEIWYELILYPDVGSEYEMLPYVSTGLLIAGVGLFIWSVYDAKELCHKYNDHLEAKGVPPW